VILLRVVLLILTKRASSAGILLVLVLFEEQQKNAFYTTRVFTEEHSSLFMGKNTVGEHKYVQEHIQRYYVLHQSVCVCLAYFLDHDLVGLPTRYDQIDHSAIPEVVCVDGWVDGCTN
jgi:hypothetical protein